MLCSDIQHRRCVVLTLKQFARTWTVGGYQQPSVAQGAALLLWTSTVLLERSSVDSGKSAKAELEMILL